MSDSIDSAVNRSANRAVFVGAGVKYLGPARQRDAEFLADLMAAVTITPSNALALTPSLKEGIGQQMQKHAEQIAHAAVVAMTDVFSKTLICAARAQSWETLKRPVW